MYAETGVVGETDVGTEMAHVGFLSRVDPVVTDQVPLDTETPPTHLTLERLLT